MCRKVVMEACKLSFGAYLSDIFFYNNGHELYIYFYLFLLLEGPFNIKTFLDQHQIPSLLSYVHLYSSLWLAIETAAVINISEIALLNVAHKSIFDLIRP